MIQDHPTTDLPPGASHRMRKQHRAMLLWLRSTEAFFRTNKMPAQAKVARQLLKSVEDFGHE